MEMEILYTQAELVGAEKDLIQIKTESRETKQKLLAEQEKIKEENLSLKTDTLILRSKKEILLSDVSRAENEMKQMKMKKNGLLEDIGVLDKEFDRRGTDYRLVGFRNVQTEENLRVYEIKDEITPKNRICTLEQAEVYVKAVESFMEEMKPEKIRHDCPVCRTDREKDRWSR